ncbi:MAG: nucleotidyltransferase domain-containing protein [Myxococcales bacterium]|nr:nucleotidyltransferase domain-containing protein [Myxococcales bacterium]MCB9754753.1 nucleotidyltransferase domain-containing protein [Myxococcales bacterium]
MTTNETQGSLIASLFEPDLEVSRRFIEFCDIPGRVLLCSATGSHYYGYPSINSSIHLRGIYLAPTAMFLGLVKAPEGYDHADKLDDIRCVAALAEARQALDLLLRGNGSVLERIMSPFQLFDRAFELEALRELAVGAVSKRFFRHYQGSFRGAQREHGRAPKPMARTLLNVYRIALTGIHLLKSGKLIADLNILAKLYNLPEASELIEFKRENGERSTVPPKLNALHKENWAQLGKDLGLAYEASMLPDQAENEDACAQWLIELRLMAFEKAEQEEFD